MDELLARFPEVPRDLRDEPILAEYVKTFGPLLRMAQKPSPCVGSSGDAQHVFYTRLVNDLAIYAIGLATRDRTLVRLQATLAQYRQQPPTFACTLVPRRGGPDQRVVSSSVSRSRVRSSGGHGRSLGHPVCGQSLRPHDSAVNRNRGDHARL